MACMILELSYLVLSNCEVALFTMYDTATSCRVKDPCLGFLK